MTPPGGSPAPEASLRERVAWVRDRVEDAARRSGRPAGSVKLIAVSKTQPVERILEAHAAGLSVFGENYVQEAEEKIPILPGAEWHFIGRLQGNKVRRAVALFPWIQTADSARRLREISRCAMEFRKTVRVLIEVNVGGEGSKAGADPGDLPAILDASRGLPGVRVEGFMAIPPISSDSGGSRRHFARLRELRDALVREHPGATIGELSMGMSNDFEVAIEEGATMVRVGTAIFGSRQGRG
jgi:pyridoxal phosphate enzyme (YggS family)